MLSKEYIQWIISSIFKHFDDLKQGILLYKEGDSLPDANDYAEIRVTGPRFEEQTKNRFYIEVDINIMCTSKSTSNIYQCLKTAGIFHAAMTDISVKRLDTDDSTIGCLTLRDRVDVLPWGLVNAETPVQQVSVEAYYKMQL